MVHENTGFPPDTELDTFFVHIIDIFPVNVVFIDGFCQECEVFVDGSRVQRLGTTDFECMGPPDAQSVPVTILVHY